MWAAGDDYNEQGEAVRLYQPILYGRKALQDDITCSFVGGRALAPSTGGASETPICTLCKDPLLLLTQLHVPKFHRHVTASSPSTSRISGEEVDRTLQVFACNQAACINKLFTEGNRLVDGSGVVVCRRMVVDAAVKSRSISDEACSQPAAHTAAPTESSCSDWAVEESKTTTAAATATGVNDWADGNDGGEWGGSTDMQDLEAKFAAMETAKASVLQEPAVAEPTMPSQQSESSKAKMPDENDKQQSPAFPCFLLHALQEPAAIQLPGTDEDDVGIAGNDDKIQKMLAKYLAEEDDEDILAVFQGSVGGGSGRNGGVEKDERLSASERAMLTFSDRMKRCPRQVLRYAYGGEPLWSIPVETQQKATRHAKQRSRKTKKHPSYYTVWEPSMVPPCPCCGAARVFELQLVPSLLHVLEVDKFARPSRSSSSSSSKRQGLGAAFDEGMNWGNIAIFSCPQACASEQEYVLVQESIDDRPSEPREFQQGDVLIQEDSKFDDDDDDEVDDDDDDDEVDDDDDEMESEDEEHENS